MELTRSLNSQNALQQIADDTEGDKKHLNIPQLWAYIVWAKVTNVLAGRATGKTHGIQGPWSIRNIFAMPRSRGNAVGSSMVQLLDNFLPEIISAWASMGYNEDEHFWVRKKPPKKFDVPKPHLPLASYDHAITWFNGTAINLISFDKNATPNNGKSSDWSMIDEARLLNKKKLDERLILTMRGQGKHFGKLHCHLSQLYTSDLPQTSSEMWLLDFQKQMNNRLIEWIVRLQYNLSVKEHELKRIPAAHAHWKQKEIEEIKRYLNTLRMKATFVMHANTLENIHVLGLNVIENFKNTLDPLTFESAVLNRLVIHIDACFYAPIPEDSLYDNYNYAYIDGKERGKERDCRYDADLQLYQPIDIHMDYGKHFNCLVNGQPLNDEYLVINSFYGEGDKGETTADVVQKFCNYYLHHKARKVRYFYDHTAKQGTGVTLETYKDTVMKAFKKNGWEIEEVYVGHPPDQDERYELMGDIIRHRNRTLFNVLWNRDRTDNVRIAMQQTPLKRNRKDALDIGKDKSSEDPRKNPSQVHATHFTDAIDGLLVYAHMHHKRIGKRKRIMHGDTLWS